MKNLNMFVGKVINSIALGSDDALHFVFEDGSKMKLWDDEGLCCERRYITVDDDLSVFSGSVLMNVEVKDSLYIDDDLVDDIHQIQFVEVITNRGCFSIVTHNEHNGYYGGFCVRIEAEN